MTCREGVWHAERGVVYRRGCGMQRGVAFREGVWHAERCVAFREGVWHAERGVAFREGCGIQHGAWYASTLRLYGGSRQNIGSQLWHRLW